MKPIKCKCGKIITTKMDVEYSQQINEYFCSPECAEDRYFEYMGSYCVDFSQPVPDGAMIKDGKLFKR
jgi:hypothetical protein